MKTKILSGLICCLGIFSANAQTITAPVGQSLSITNSMDVTLPGGKISVPIDGAFNFGVKNALSFKNYSLSIGPDAGNAGSTGFNNVFLGENAGVANTLGAFNLFLGSYAGVGNTDGNFNTFMGTNAGRSNVSGQYNTYIGLNSGFSNIQSFNLFLGGSSGQNSVGGNNVFLGPFSGKGTTPVATTGTDNTFVGSFSGDANTSGSRNVLVGKDAGKDPNNSANDNTTGSDNVYIGYKARGGSSTLTNAVAIGSGATVATSNTIVLGNNATTVTGQGLPSPGGGIGVSGLRFPQLTSGNNPTLLSGTIGKVLSVDGSGNVILVQITGATTNSTGEKQTDAVATKSEDLTNLSKQIDAITNKVGDMKMVKTTWIEKDGDGYLHNVTPNGVVVEGKGLDGNSLIVKGGVLSKEVNVKVEGSESWPDYVFKPNYKRMALGEVEKFISINGHLPNIPSATEMAATGNNLGKTDAKLLEKVEELTLYLLDMKKANDAQAAELKALKQQVSKLRKK